MTLGIRGRLWNGSSLSSLIPKRILTQLFTISNSTKLLCNLKHVEPCWNVQHLFPCYHLCLCSKLDLFWETQNKIIPSGSWVIFISSSVFPYPHLSSFFFAFCLQFKNSASVDGCLWLFLGPHLIVKSLTKNFFPDKYKILSKRNTSQKFIFFFYFGDCSYCFALGFAFEAGAHYIDLAVLQQALQTILALNSRRCPCPCPCPCLCLLWDKPSVYCEYMLLSLVDNKSFFGL